jgi:DNA-binding transcriptional regulator YiaG
MARERHNPQPEMAVAVVEALLAADAPRHAELPDPAVCRMLRRRAGLTLVEMAAALGINHGTLSRWETGLRHPHGAKRAAYAAVLDRLARQ